MVSRLPIFRQYQPRPSLFALVDYEDYQRLSAYRWFTATSGSQRHVKGRMGGGRDSSMRLLHREVMGLGASDPRVVDHINGDPLDNRRENLRVVTQAENCQNSRTRVRGSSRHRGVSWDSRYGCWRAYGRVDYVQHHIGYFDDEDEAGKAADEWRRHHMPFYGGR